MSNGDLSDISTGSNTLYSCLYTNCGSGCTSTSPKDTSKNIKEIMGTYATCKVAGITPNSNVEKYFRSDMSAAYVAYINSIQKASERSSASYALSEDVKTARTELDKQLANIYQHNMGTLSEYKTHYESTLMSGLLWGTLAATVTYYVLYS